MTQAFAGRGRSRQFQSGSSRHSSRGFRGNRWMGQGSRGNQGFNRSAGVKIAHERYINAAVQSQATEEVYQAKHTFNDFGFNEQLVKNIVARGYVTPTPIQDQAIPALMQGQDVVGIANTGTGKTAAFLLPLIHKVQADLNQGVLILAPTRELAVQILEELQFLLQDLPIGFVSCIGGMNIENQIKKLKISPHFVVGTPGRIKDLINRRAFKPDLFSNIVLDEVDRMLDIGFRKDILFLIDQLPQERHAALFSATMNEETQGIIRNFLNNPVQIKVKKRETAHNVHQDIVKVQPGENKIDILHDLLLQAEFEKVIVFGRTKHGINKLEMHLEKRGIRVSSIHGNKSQNARQRSLQDFKQGRVQALLATDVAARGIDIAGVTHVINYDEPATYEDYVHRIGRTGRAGKTGKALTFVS